MPKPNHPYHLLREKVQARHAELLVVSKTRTPGQIEELYQMGQRLFGENRAQELLEKAPALPVDIQWHLIGHLQTNKVRAILPYITCIQSLDSTRLWDKIEEEGRRLKKKINCLLQIKIATEENKYGWSFPELMRALESGVHLNHPHTEICGVMGMSTLTHNQEQVRQEMRMLKMYFDQIRSTHFRDHAEFRTISMGMSGDYEIALQEGSTMIRIGSLLFP